MLSEENCDEIGAPLVFGKLFLFKISTESKRHTIVILKKRSIRTYVNDGRSVSGGVARSTKSAIVSSVHDDVARREEQKMLPFGPL